MSKSNQFIHVNGMREAWSTAYDLARDVLHGLGVSLVHFAYDADASKAAGYAIYRAAPDCDGLPVMLHYNYICDLGDALELNTCRGDWSGVVYRIVYAGAAAAPAAVADGDGLQGSGVYSAEGSAAAGAIPAEGSPVAGADSVQGSETGAAAPAVRRFSIRTRRGLRMICREKHARTVSRSFDGSSVVMVQKWDVLRDGSIYARTLQGFFGPARRCGSWSEYVQQVRGYVSSIRREVAALVKICGGEVIA